MRLYPFKLSFLLFTITFFCPDSPTAYGQTATSVSLPAEVASTASKSCIKQLQSLLGLVATSTRGPRDSVALLTGRATRKLSAESYAIFEKVRHDPNYEPSASEITTLRNEGKSPLDFSGSNSQGVLPLFEKYRKTSQFVYFLNHASATLTRSKPKNPSKIGWKKLLDAWKYVLPILPSPTKARVEFIFRKVLKDPTYKLSVPEIKFLKKHNLLNDYHRFREDLALHRDTYAVLSRARMVGDFVKWSIILSGVGLGIAGTEYISTQQSLDEDDDKGMSRYDEKVEIIFLSPLPHASIKVRGLVYNYGVFTVNRYTLDEFKKMVGFGELMSGNHTRIELKLTPEETSRLRDYLEDDVGKVYPLVIPYNDCVSQTNKAVKHACGIDVPIIADRSQALSIAYYKLQKLLGNPKVGDIKFASKGGNTATEKAKDVGVNVLDSYLFMKFWKSAALIVPFLENSDTTYDVEDTNK